MSDGIPTPGAQAAKWVYAKINEIADKASPETLRILLLVTTAFESAEMGYPINAWFATYHIKRACVAAKKEVEVKACQAVLDAIDSTYLDGWAFRKEAN